MESHLIGILLDVSGSMRQGIGDGVDDQESVWIQSIFSVIDNLIKHDLQPNNHVFAIGVGANRDKGPSVFDLLGTLKDVRQPLESTLNRVLGLLEANGASTVRKWAPMNVLKESLDGQEMKCSLILKKLESDEEYLQYFVDKCLPSVCKDYEGNGLAPTSTLNSVYGIFASAVTTFRTATREDIDEVVKKAQSKVNLQQNVDIKLKCVSAQSIFNVNDAHSILHGFADDDDEDDDLTMKQTRKLLDIVEPFMYGESPLITALEFTTDLFSQEDFHDHKKLLFVLSDGKPNDGWFFEMPSKYEITIVSCLISTSPDVNSRVLFSTDSDKIRSFRAKFMFQLSSTIPTQQLPRTIFLKRGWNIEMTNNETKLFLQVNHPDHLKDACNLARDVMTSQEALSDVLTSVDLDVFINKSTVGFSAKTQIGPTCFANASAAVMHLAMRRILGREGGYPDFEVLRNEMTGCYSEECEVEHGADTEVVLDEMCPQYRLKCKQVDQKKAMIAVMEKRPVVARFRLTNKEWNDFGRFFLQHPKGILTTDDIKIRKRQDGEGTTGHAVVLTSFNSRCLRLMNSWGTEFADDGFFNVQNADVLDFEFFDVFWDEQDLTANEKNYYTEHGSAVAKNMMKNFKGLNEAMFKCPLCQNTSKVTEFKGRMSKVICPKCRGQFKCYDHANTLTLNLYLASLCDLEDNYTAKSADRVQM